MQCCNRHARAHMQLPALSFNALQIAHTAQKRHLSQIAKLLGHPQPYIRRPGNQRGIRIGQIPVSEFITVARAESAGGLSAPQTPRGYFWAKNGCIGFHPIRHRGGFCGLCRADDRRIACAAAQIARQHIIMIRRTVQMPHRHADHKARSAKPALRPVMFHHCRLHRVQRAIRCADPFNSAHRAAHQLWQEQDAGVQRAAAVSVRHHHRAGAAIALVAPFLGAAKPACFAQPIQQRGRGQCALRHHRRAIQQKFDPRHAGFIRRLTQPSRAPQTVDAA